MKIADFEKRMENAVLVADGAMGSVLFESAGVQRCFEELNILQPEAVFRVHQAYIQAGAQIIETNTFGANRSKLAPLGLADSVAAFNHRGVKLAREAREAAPHEVLIAGSIGPLGMGPEIGQLSHEEILEIYREQALALEERGVDLFILETFSNIDILLAAIDAIRSFSLLPVVAQLTFSEEGTSLDGTRPADAAARLASRNIQAIGANCTLGPQSLLPVLEGLAAAGRPISAMPNAGFPQARGRPHRLPALFTRIFRSLRPRKRRPWAPASSAGAAALRPNTFARLPKRFADCLLPRRSVKVVSSEFRQSRPPERPVAKREPESGIWRKLQARRVHAFGRNRSPQRHLARSRL